MWYVLAAAGQNVFSFVPESTRGEGFSVYTRDLINVSDSVSLSHRTFDFRERTNEVAAEFWCPCHRRPIGAASGVQLVQVSTAEHGATDGSE